MYPLRLQLTAWGIFCDNYSCLFPYKLRDCGLKTSSAYPRKTNFISLHPIGLYLRPLLYERDGT